VGLNLTQIGFHLDFLRPLRLLAPSGKAHRGGWEDLQGPFR
jgi:hypothetical protein